MTAKKLYHRLYARVVRARLRWSASPPVFFARKRYWLSTMVAVAVVIGAVASVLAWRSHVERANRELDAQALAGATSVVNAYCDAILKGNVDEAAAMDGLADSSDPNWMLSDAGEDFRAEARSYLSVQVSEGTLSPDRLSATFAITSTRKYGESAPEHVEMVARRDSVDAPWTIATSLARRVVVTFPAGTSAAFFNNDAIETFDPSEGWPEAVHTVSLTLYPGLYQIGARSFSIDMNIVAVPKSSQFPYDEDYATVGSLVRVPFVPVNEDVSVSPFSSDKTLLERETALQVGTVMISCINGEIQDANLCPDFTRGVYDPVPRNRMNSTRDAFNIAVTLDSPTSFTVTSLEARDPATGNTQDYTGTVTVSYDDKRHQTITAITLSRF